MHDCKSLNSFWVEFVSRVCQIHIRLKKRVKCLYLYKLFFLFLIAEFTQGMILPTANGVAKPQSTSQSKAKLDKTEVGAHQSHSKDFVL